MAIWFALTFLAWTGFNGRTYLEMQLICSLTDLTIIGIVYLSAIRMIVELLLYSANYIFPGWEPGPSI